MKNNIFLWLAIVLVVVTGWLLVPNIFWQYAFFLRVPLLMGVSLLSLSAIAYNHCSKTVLDSYK